MSTFDRDSINQSCFTRLHHVIATAISGHRASLQPSYLHCIIRSSCLRADHRIYRSEGIALSLVCYTRNRMKHTKITEEYSCTQIAYEYSASSMLSVLISFPAHGKSKSTTHGAFRGLYSPSIIAAFTKRVSSPNFRGDFPDSLKSTNAERCSIIFALSISKRSDLLFDQFNFSPPQPS